MIAKSQAEHNSSGKTASMVLREALRMPSGARFFRCALQVNPFAYVKRHGVAHNFVNELEYNQAIVGALLANDVEIIAVTDHWEFDQASALSLASAAREAGLFVFAGYEAKSAEGVHILCLFDPEFEGRIASFRGECGVHDENHGVANKTVAELIACMQSHGGICVAPHVLREGGGFFTILKGQAAIRAWKSEHLMAAAIAGPVENAGKTRAILENNDVNYKRARPVAIINANDVSSPSDAADQNSACLIKMSKPSVEALRQAFLDPVSRIRLHTDATTSPDVELVAIAWQGGFLDEVRVHFNSGLNAIIGGRGAGKSTIVESVRYALGLLPLGDDARRSHDAVIKNVLKSGTKISVLARSHQPNERFYTIERTVPNPSVVRDDSGSVMPVTPADMVRGIEVFGQHEIAELARSKDKRTMLLARFTREGPRVASRRTKLVMELEKSRGRIAEKIRELSHVRERLASLPALEETLTRYQQSGLEARLSEKSKLVREERVIALVEERLAPIRQTQSEVAAACPIDSAFASDRSLADLPNASILAEIRPILDLLSSRVTTASNDIAFGIAAAETSIRELRGRWQEGRKRIDEAYEKILRELQKERIDGQEFISLRRSIEELRPLQERERLLLLDLEALNAERRALLVEWEDVKAEHYRDLSKAAATVSGRLQNRVRVSVINSGLLDPLEELLRSSIAGNLKAMLERFASSDRSVSEIASACREGTERLVERYGLSVASAERLVRGGPELTMKIEELDLPPTTGIELNTAAAGLPANWQSLDHVSAGQQATAVLLLLLLESDRNGPLIVDQPEDDLDNRFVSDGIVPIVRSEKTRRQFVLSTHNANIPVLGDAELIVGLSTTVRDGNLAGVVPRDHVGSIDAEPVRQLVEDVLEGGKAAFETRRLKYNF